MSELEQQIENRREKRRALQEAGIDPYPIRYAYDAEPARVRALHDHKDAETLEQEAHRLRLPGRIKALRKHGKLYFLDLSDGAEKVQAMVRRNKLSETAKTVLEHLDLGDYVGVEGTLIRTRTGELTIQTEDLVLLSKALRPLPEKWHGLKDIEVRYRQRYLDLATSAESRRVFETRARLVEGIREFLRRHDFLEVETPMMHSLAGGAAARPFATHHNALDMPLYLRIAPELFLKRLLVGGLHRVYEINRNFRNEGISTQHNPEFTMLEFYWAYSDYEQLMDFTEEMITSIAEDLLGGAEVLPWQEEEIPLSRPWARYTMRDAVAHFASVDQERLDSVDGLKAELEARHLELPPVQDYGHLLMTLFEETVEQHLLAPTFITDHPVEVSPLAKQRTDDPRFTERFELYIGRMEIANAFSELNDPDVQAERFHQQLNARDAGAEETHAFDHDYVRALEHGMPPAGGEGIGIDRLTMLLTDRSSIRDVILFPLLKPEAGQEDSAEADGDAAGLGNGDSGNGDTGDGES
ncbi:MAG: lysine--tRNA ligase [Acidobacteriota bacterium]